MSAGLSASQTMNPPSASTRPTNCRIVTLGCHFEYSSTARWVSASPCWPPIPGRTRHSNTYFITIDFLSPQPPMRTFYRTARRHKSSSVLDFQPPSNPLYVEPTELPFSDCPGTWSRGTPPSYREWVLARCPIKGAPPGETFPPPRNSWPHAAGNSVAAQAAGCECARLP